MTTPAMGNSNAKLLRYNPSLEEAIFQFQRQAYPRRRRDWIAPRWRWMFVDSAQRMGVEPMVWVYRRRSQIQAHQGAIPIKLQVAGAQYTTGWFVETMALESVRGKTVGPAVVMKAQQDLPFNLSLGQTESMRELQFRLGWKQVAPLETFVLPLRPLPMVRDKAPHVGLAALAAAALKARTGAKRVVSGPKWFGRRALDVAFVDRFDQRHDQLWNVAKESYTCAVVRDASYLNWKYVDQPGQDFIRLELSQAGRILAVAILSIAQPDSDYSYRRGFLVDLVAPLSDRSLLLDVFQVLRSVCARRNVDALLFHVINKTLQATAQSYGFLRRQPTRFLLVRPEHKSADVNAAVLAADNWLITMGDSDIDRPW